MGQYERFIYTLLHFIAYMFLMGGIISFFYLWSEIAVYEVDMIYFEGTMEESNSLGIVICFSVLISSIGSWLFMTSLAFIMKNIIEKR